MSIDELRTILSARRVPDQGPVASLADRLRYPSILHVHAYFDESEADTVYFISGWIATEEVWTAFTPAWNDTLASEPSIKYLRHNEAKGLKGEFAGWTHEDVARKIEALVEVICAHEMHETNASSPGVTTSTG